MDPPGSVCPHLLHDGALGGEELRLAAAGQLRGHLGRLFVGLGNVLLNVGVRIMNLTHKKLTKKKAMENKAKVDAIVIFISERIMKMLETIHTVVTRTLILFMARLLV